VQYEGIRQEHVAVRTGAGVFDVSHMGEIETSGAGAEEFLQRILSNDVSRIADGGAQYSVLCREDGGVLDDLFTYRLGDDRFLTVTNASNHEKDLAWFSEHAGEFDVDVADAHDRWAMLAVQGPEARAAVARIASGELPARMRTADVEVAGVDCIVCGTGYTGEDGVEILIPPDGATAVWDALMEQGVTPVGLGARDTLRLEMGLPLHGQELGPGITPLQAGLGWVVAWGKGDFRGRAALEAEREKGPARKLRGLVVEGRRPPRAHQPVLVDGEPAGETTSGNFSPSLGVGIALAFLPPDVTEDAELAVDVRGTAVPARLASLPFYRPAPATPPA